MSRLIVYEVDVMFGDCDPAGIVFFPNFLKWMDASSHNFFVKCGLPPFRVLEKTRGIIGHPLLEINTRFFRPATYGETLEIHTTVEAWKDKVFIHKHVIKRSGEILCESTETRTFVTKHPDDPSRIKSIKVPEDVINLCS
ncbi:MAG: acyl-CoA thioesterase [Polaromonas sp.]|nr:acyl-CoA thioesterase [Polaromonas sp.]